MADFEIAFGETEINEGGYVNDPVDEGGETYRGVTRRFHPDWPGWAIVDKHKAVSPDSFQTCLDNDESLHELVKQVYRRDYWNPIRGDEIPNQHIANKVFDTGVNQGVARSIRYLQESLNLLNRNQKDYADIAVDGTLGDVTLATLQQFMQLEHGQPDYLLKSLALMQGSYYLDILRRKPAQQKFARGWLNRVGLR
jgi:lysozyme family protein